MMFVSLLSRNLRISVKNSSFSTLHKMSPKIDVSLYEMQGDRPYMEDRTVIGYENCFSAVFDGHAGSQVANRCHEIFLTILESNNPIEQTNKQIQDSLQKSISEMDIEIVSQKKWKGVGAATTMSFINFHDKIPSIITANLGDSRVVLSQNGKAINLTEDHKPNLPKEKERVEALEGCCW